METTSCRSRSNSFCSFNSGRGGNSLLSIPTTLNTEPLVLMVALGESVDSTLTSMSADMEVNVESTDSPKATISTRGSVFNVVGMDSKEFPPLPELNEQKEFDLDRQEVVSMLKSVSYAQSVNEERYMLKGVFFQFSKDRDLC